MGHSHPKSQWQRMVKSHLLVPQQQFADVMFTWHHIAAGQCHLLLLLFRGLDQLCSSNAAPGTLQSHFVTLCAVEDLKVEGALIHLVSSD